MPRGAKKTDKSFSFQAGWRKRRERFLKMAEVEGNQVLTIPGEPLIYSMRYNISKRQLQDTYFVKRQYASILRSMYRSYYNEKTPLVLLLRFYVSPP